MQENISNGGILTWSDSGIFSTFLKHMASKTNTLVNMFSSRDKNDSRSTNQASNTMTGYIPAAFRDLSAPRGGQYSNPKSQIRESDEEASTRIRWVQQSDNTAVDLTPNLSLSLPRREIMDSYESVAASDEPVHRSDYSSSSEKYPLGSGARYDNLSLEGTKANHETGSGSPMCRVSSGTSPSKSPEPSDDVMGLNFDEVDVGMWRDGKGRVCYVGLSLHCLTN